MDLENIVERSHNHRRGHDDWDRGGRFRWISPVVRLLRIVAGTFLIILAVIGFLIPLVPGWPFMVAAVFVLGPKTRLVMWIKQVMQRVRDKLRRMGWVGSVRNIKSTD